MHLSHINNTYDVAVIIRKKYDNSRCQAYSIVSVRSSSFHMFLQYLKKKTTHRAYCRSLILIIDPDHSREESFL